MTPPRPAQVVSELALRLVVPDRATLPVAASLRFVTSDPYAVHVTFRTGRHSDDPNVVWTFARQLLADGLTGPAGMGDVRVWPITERRGRVVALALCSPSGEALFEVPRDALSDFLQRTYAEVPPGYEDRHFDIDAEIAVLLGDA
jgi:hypothetical protein